MVRLLEVQTGPWRFAILFHAVGRISALDAGAPRLSLAAAVGLAGDWTEPKALHVPLPEARAISLAVGSVGETWQAPVLPLPALPGDDAHAGAAAALPFSGVAVFGERQRLVLDPSKLAGLHRPAAPADGPTAFMAQPVPDVQRELLPGEPLLVCSPGKYRLRGRPLAIGVPLSGVRGVRGAHEVVPLPAPESALAGFTVFEGRVIPVYAAAALLGLPATSAPGGKLVVFQRGAGLAGLVVASASEIERPLHWASAALLRPLAGPSLAGALPLRPAWVAILDPQRIGAANFSARATSHPAA